MSNLTITTIQANLHWEDSNANLQMFEHSINGITDRTEVVILPEMFSTGFSMRPKILAEKKDGKTVRWMKRIAAEKKIVITGSVIIEENYHYYNRLIWMLPNGQYGYYDKRHLFTLGGEQDQFTRGKKRFIASVNGWKINLVICYDLRFPVWSRQSLYAEQKTSPEYDLLICVANWPDRRSQAWKTLLQARAIENQCFVAGVNRIGKDGNDLTHNGDTMVIDPLGEILYQKSGEEDVNTITLDKQKLDDIRLKLPFWKDGDEFHIEP
jgi:predicted amidohydrolase